MHEMSPSSRIHSDISHLINPNNLVCWKLKLRRKKAQLYSPIILNEKKLSKTTDMINWTPIKQYEDILFEQYGKIAKITINRPWVYNAFRPQTNREMLDAMAYCREANDIGVIILTGAGDKAFCSGGDQKVKGVGGYIDENGVPRLNVLDLHKAIRSIPKPVIAMVNGYAIGGGHVLHVVCDLTIAASSARFGQTGPKVGSFDAGFGSTYLARCVGQKKRVKFGSSADSTPPKKLNAWVWLTKLFH